MFTKMSIFSTKHGTVLRIIIRHYHSPQAIYAHNATSFVTSASMLNDVISTRFIMRFANALQPRPQGISWEKNHMEYPRIDDLKY